MYNGVRDPSLSHHSAETLTLRKEEFINCKSVFKIRFANISLDHFSISIKGEDAVIQKKHFGSFSTSYMCEKDFYCFINIKAGTEIFSFQLKMKSMCVYLKYNPELSICTAKRKRKQKEERERKKKNSH